MPVPGRPISGVTPHDVAWAMIFKLWPYRGDLGGVDDASVDLVEMIEGVARYITFIALIPELRPEHRS